MKNIFLAFLLLAGTAVMAQTGSMKAEASKMETKTTETALTAKEEIQKSLDITADQADRVMAIQQKFCGPDAKSETKKQGSSAKSLADSEVNDKAFHAALTEVITAEQADKFMKDCKVSCASTDAKTEAKSKSCCSSSSTASKKSCSDKK